MNEPIFDHEKLDVYRVSIEDITRIRGVVKSLSGVLRPIRDQWMRAAQSIPLNIAAGNGKESLKDQNRFFEIARGSALECAAIHDVLDSCELIDSGMSPHGKTELKRVVSMLTRLIQRSDAVREDRIEYEYRDAEYEHETADEPEPSRAPEPGLRPFFHPDDFPSNDRLPRWIASLLSEDPSEWYLNGYCHRNVTASPNALSESLRQFRPISVVSACDGQWYVRCNCGWLAALDGVESRPRDCNSFYVAH